MYILFKYDGLFTPAYQKLRSEILVTFIKYGVELTISEVAIAGGCYSISTLFPPFIIMIGIDIVYFLLEMNKNIASVPPSYFMGKS